MQKSLAFMNPAMKNRVLKEQGFTLIEILVAISILSVISLGVMRINEMMNKTSKNMNQQLDATQLMARIDSVLRNRLACQNTFRGEVLASTANALDNALVDPNWIIDDSNNRIVGPGSTFGDLTVTSITWTGIQAASVTPITIDVAGTPTTVYERNAQVRFNLRKGKNASDTINHQKTVGSLQIVKTLNFTFFVNGAGNDVVQGCNSNEGQYVEAACSALEGTMEGATCRSIRVRPLTGLNYSALFDGRVGIGTTNPQSSLQIVGGDAQFDVGFGPLWSANSDSAFITFRSTSDAAGASYLEIGTRDNGDEPIIFTQNGTERARIHTNGALGVATAAPTTTLDVRGTVNITQSGTYDVWIQGGAAGAGAARNLAMLGVIASDQLIINYNGEYTGGTWMQGPTHIQGAATLYSTTTLAGPTTVTGAYLNVTTSLCMNATPPSANCATSWNAYKQSCRIIYAYTTPTTPTMGFNCNAEGNEVLVGWGLAVRGDAWYVAGHAFCCTIRVR